MPRRCTVCDSPARAQIDRALVRRSSPFRTIAHQFGVTRDALMRHDAEHLPARLVEAQRAEDEAEALDILGELKRCLERVNLLFDACDRWLRDADDPTRYDIGPRSEDVRVSYWAVGPDGTMQRKKERLSKLLEKLEGIAPVVEIVETKHADPRELVLKTADRLQAQLELLARLVGKLEAPAVNVFVTPAWREVQAILLGALAPHPQLRARVAEALASVGEEAAA